MARLVINGSNNAETIRQNNRPNVEIHAFGGNDKVILDRDDDLGGDNFVDAGKGNDKVFNVFEGGNRILLGSGNDSYFGTGFSLLNQGDIVDGGAGNDKIFVSTLQSLYKGGSGNDTFFSAGQKNNFAGGTGNDTISYQFRHEDSVVGDEGVTISLFQNKAQTGSNSFENYTSIENAIGSENGDAIEGSNGKNILKGLGGDDDIFGLNGTDIITGGRGSDFLTGGGGRDKFVFESLQDSVTGLEDIIKDFTSGDIIDLKKIDANREVSGNQIFTFIGGSAFSGDGGEVRLVDGILSLDTGGSSDADMVIGVFREDGSGVTTLQASDFQL